MKPEIKKFPVQHPLLKNYIKFFWQLNIDQVHLYHKIIPQKNINLRINLSETPHYICLDHNENKTEPSYFSGIQDQFRNLHLKIDGKVDVFGICFYPDGFYPFIKIPISEFKNQLLGLSEAGISLSDHLADKLRDTPDSAIRLNIAENELLAVLIKNNPGPDNFRKIFTSMNRPGFPLSISEVCRNNNISVRTLERMYNKYIGVSASTYYTLNRFHGSVNQMLNHDFLKLSDLAYDQGYFDQMHFIRDFKRFAGNTPKDFLQQNDSILNIGKLS